MAFIHQKPHTATPVFPPLMHRSADKPKLTWRGRASAALPGIPDHPSPALYTKTHRPHHHAHTAHPLPNFSLPKLQSKPQPSPLAPIDPGHPYAPIHAHPHKAQGTPTLISSDSRGWRSRTPIVRFTLRNSAYLVMPNSVHFPWLPSSRTRYPKRLPQARHEHGGNTSAAAQSSTANAGSY